jgi:hypothetical protein
MTTQEWKDLPTLQDVAAAQAAGDEIQWMGSLDMSYETWGGAMWAKSALYRSRPVPKTRKVKRLAYDDGYELFWRAETVTPTPTWRRVPAEDKEIEVTE